MSRKCQFTLPDSLYERLVAESLRTGRSQAEYARRGLEAVLPKEHRQATIRGVEVAVFVRDCRAPGGESTRGSPIDASTNGSALPSRRAMQKTRATRCSYSCGG